MYRKGVFLGAALAAVLAFTSSANAVTVSSSDQVAAGYAGVDTSSFLAPLALPTGSNWAVGGEPSDRFGNQAGVYRSPFDGSTSSADAGGGSKALGGVGDGWKSYGYWAVGPGNPDNPGILDFDINQFAFSFLWGSPDHYNEISFWLGGAPVFAMTITTANAAGAGIPAIPTGGGAYLVSVTDILFDQIQFYSDPNNALEFSNIVTSAVPIPPALLLFGSALVGFGYLARRRRNANPQPVAA